MDHFGIGQAMRGLALGYMNMARRTGRTTSLLDSLRDGDRIVCLNEKHAMFMRQLLRERKLQVTVLVCAPSHAYDIHTNGPSEGRTLFDHPWVEQFYLDALNHADRSIGELQQRLSRDRSMPQSERRFEEHFRWSGIDRFDQPWGRPNDRDTFDGGGK